MAEQLVPELPFDITRRGYAVGTTVLQAVLPPHDGPTARVPAWMDDDGLATRDGVEAKEVVLRQLASALDVIRVRRPRPAQAVPGLAIRSQPAWTPPSVREAPSVAAMSCVPMTPSSAS
ncbi:hypothetical protein ACFVW1_00320 [Streptomyces olivochromogenes]|uniref:hypothetical protein n=1 Tax=Streptomyces olivochromogenes TaxID=1963 RepID=UPI0036D7F97D